MSKDKISCVFCIYNLLGKIEEIYKIVLILKSVMSRIKIVYIYIYMHIR